MIRSSQFGQVVLGLLVAFAGSATLRAADITFDLKQIAFNQTTSSLTSGGYTLLFTSSSGTFSGSTSPNTGGLKVSVLNTFSVQKTAGATDLIFKNYKLGNVDNYTGNSLSFSLTGGTGTSNNNTFTALSTNNYNGSYSLAGSQSATFSLNGFGSDTGDDDSVYFNTLTFSTVPEPSTYALMAIATGVMGVLARRRKATKA